MIVPEIMRVGFKYIAKTNSGYTAIIILRLIPSPLVIRQGGKSARTDRYETVKFPIAFTAIFSITGQALTSYVLAGSDSNFGIKNNFSVTEFTTSMYDNGNYYAGFHWVAFGLA